MPEIQNTDDLIDAMKAHEFEGAEVLTPRDYAKLRGMSPQLVYYHIRNNHIDTELCRCGRKVINIDLADKYLQKGTYSDDSTDPTEGA